MAKKKGNAGELPAGFTIQSATISRKKRGGRVSAEALLTITPADLATVKVPDGSAVRDILAIFGNPISTPCGDDIFLGELLPFPELEELTSDIQTERPGWTQIRLTILGRTQWKSGPLRVRVYRAGESSQPLSGRWNYIRVADGWVEFSSKAEETGKDVDKDKVVGSPTCRLAKTFNMERLSYTL